MNAIYIFSYVTLNSVKPFHSYGLHLCKVIATKGRFYIGKIFNSRGNGQENQQCRLSIAFGTLIWRTCCHVKVLFLKPKRHSIGFLGEKYCWKSIPKNPSQLIIIVTSNNFTIELLHIEDTVDLFCFFRMFPAIAKIMSIKFGLIIKKKKSSVTIHVIMMCFTTNKVEVSCVLLATVLEP